MLNSKYRRSHVNFTCDLLSLTYFNGDHLFNSSLFLTLNFAKGAVQMIVK